MCSSTRGPAICPSLVTWPTSRSAKPRRLATRISSCAERAPARPCPARSPARRRTCVWMESMTTRSGALGAVQRRDDVAHVGRRRELHVRRRKPQPIGAQAKPGRSPPRRRCRRPQCRARLPPAMAAQTCSSNVDLPMPGSPPIRRAEPRTSPPPVTRSNSAMPVLRRMASIGAGAVHVHQFDLPAALGGQALRRRVRARLLDDRVPSAAGLAPAAPLATSPRRRTGRHTGWQAWPCLLTRRLAIDSPPLRGREHPAQQDAEGGSLKRQVLIGFSAAHCRCPI